MVVWLALASLAISTVYPVIFVVLSALRTKDDYRRGPLALPNAWTMENLTYVWEGVSDYFINSVVVVVPTVTLSTGLACLAAYAFVHIRFPFRRAGLSLAFVMLVLPPTVLMMPTFKIVVDLGLLNSHVGVILVYLGLNLPFSIYLLQSYMRSIPRELLDAAAVDGAGDVRRLVSIVLPLVKPALLTLATLSFISLWNEFLYALIILQSDAQRTLVVGVATTMEQYRDNLPRLAAQLLIPMLPPLIVFLLFQRDLAIGVTRGAVD